MKTSQAEDLWTVIASYEGEREDVGFTLRVYSHRKASWIHALSKLLYSKDVSGRQLTQKREAIPTSSLGRRRVHAEERRGQSHVPHLLPQPTVSSARASPRGPLLTRQQGCEVRPVHHRRHGPTHPCKPYARLVARRKDQRVRPAAPIPRASHGAKIPNRLGHNDLALSSGPYSYGYATAFGHVPRTSTSFALVIHPLTRPRTQRATTR